MWKLRRVRVLVVPAVLALSSWSCAAGPGVGGGGPNTISAAEVEAAHVSNAYELVEHLRPLWLRSRGGRSTRLETEIVVYLNRSMLGGIDTLRDIPIETIRSVRVLDAAEAGRLPGLGSRHVERAIMVETGGGSNGSGAEPVGSAPLRSPAQGPGLMRLLNSAAG